MTVPGTQMPDRGPILVSIPPPWISVIPRKQAEAGNIPAPQVVDTPRGGHAPRSGKSATLVTDAQVAWRAGTQVETRRLAMTAGQPAPPPVLAAGAEGMTLAPHAAGHGVRDCRRPHQRARSSPRLGHDRCSRAHVPSNGRDAACVVLLSVSLLSSVQHRHRVGMQLGTVARLAAVVLPCSTPHLLNHEQTPHGPARHRLRSAR